MARASDSSGGTPQTQGYDWEKISRQGNSKRVQYTPAPAPTPAHTRSPEQYRSAPPPPQVDYTQAPTNTSRFPAPPPPSAYTYGPNNSAMRFQDDNAVVDQYGRWVPGNPMQTAWEAVKGWVDQANKDLRYAALKPYYDRAAQRRAMPDTYMQQRANRGNPYQLPQDLSKATPAQQQAYWQAQNQYAQMYPNGGRNGPTPPGAGYTATQFPDQWLNANPGYKTQPSVAQQIFQALTQRPAQTQARQPMPVTPNAPQNYNWENYAKMGNTRPVYSTPYDKNYFVGGEIDMNAGYETPFPNIRPTFKKPPTPQGGGWNDGWGGWGGWSDWDGGGGGGGGGGGEYTPSWYERMLTWNFG